MIANTYLNEWRQTVPWSDNKMVEQDLIISRLLVELFNHPKIFDSLAFRGGTAIYKLFASHPVRYSEDIDLVQIKAEPIGDTVTAIRSIVYPMLGEPERKRSKKTFTLTYDILAEALVSLLKESVAREPPMYMPTNSFVRIDCICKRSCRSRSFISLYFIGFKFDLLLELCTIHHQ